MFKNLNKNVVISWTVAIVAAWGFQYLLLMVLPANSPYIWVRWMAIPVAYGVQKLVLSELNNPSKDREDA